MKAARYFEKLWLKGLDFVRVTFKYGRCVATWQPLHPLFISAPSTRP